MRRGITTIHLIAVAITLAISSTVFAQDKTISEGQRLKVEGIVTERLDDVFKFKQVCNNVSSEFSRQLRGADGSGDEGDGDERSK